MVVTLDDDDDEEVETELVELDEEDELDVETLELDELLLEVLTLLELDDELEVETELVDEDVLEELELVVVSISPAIPDLNANSDILCNLRYSDIRLSCLSAKIHPLVRTEGKNDLITVFHHARSLCQNIRSR